MLLIKNFTKCKLNKNYLNKAAEEVLKVARIKKQAEISLVITGDKRIRSLNKKYRNIDKVTDVLSFGNEEKCGAVKFVDPADSIVYLGEIFICYSRAVSQAKQEKHTVQKEITILLIHGILHLLGYDHKKHKVAKIMKKEEEKIWKGLFACKKL